MNIKTFLSTSVGALVSASFAIAIGIASTTANAAPGDIDTTFSGGIVLGYEKETTQYAASTIDAKDNIYSAAVFGDLAGTTSNLVVFKHLPDGTPDASFGTSGRAYPIMLPATTFQAPEIAIDSQGRIVVMASGPQHFYFWRFKPNGAPDTGFGFSGLRDPNFSTAAFPIVHLAIDAKDRIVGVGSVLDTAGRWRFTLVRLLASNGAMDTSFGASGFVTSFFRDNDRATGVAIQAKDGKIVVGGRSQRAGDYDFAVARYLDNGTLDAAFGTGGSTFINMGAKRDMGRRVALDAKGRITIAGSVCDINALGDAECKVGIARLKSNGVLDSSFNGSGTLVDSFTGYSTSVYNLALDTRGNILLAGQIMKDVNDPASTYYATLIRVTTAGSADFSFGTGGATIFAYANNFDSAYSVNTQTWGGIVSSGGSCDGSGSATLSAVCQASWSRHLP